MKFLWDEITSIDVFTRPPIFQLGVWTSLKVLPDPLFFSWGSGMCETSLKVLGTVLKYCLICFLILNNAGTTVYNALVKLFVTLLVLKKLSVMTSHRFPLEFHPKISVVRGEYSIPSENRKAVNEAIQFAITIDKKYPVLYSRLELGSNWDNALSAMFKVK